MLKIEKPQPGEYKPYAIMYIKLLPHDGLITKYLKDNFNVLKDFISSIPKDKLLYRYAENKWTIKEVLVHMMDDEGIYACRALRIARKII
jgi:hypothetical protein